MIDADETTDPQLEARLRSWGNWARESAPQVSPAMVSPAAFGSRNRRWPTILAAALVVAIASLTAAAPRLLNDNRPGHHTGTEPAANAPFPAAFDGALTTRLHLPSAGIELSPPAANALAATAITWQQALDTCRTSGSLCFSDLTAHVYLADFTKTDSQPDARVGWVIDYQGARCVPFGQPPAQSTASPSTPPLHAYDCRIVNIIDLQSGALLWSVREPTP